MNNNNKTLIILITLSPQERSEVITTYALCGFSNLASIGMILAVLGPLAPARKGEAAKLALRAMIAGNIACFMTASIAGRRRRYTRARPGRVWDFKARVSAPRVYLFPFNITFL